MVTNLAAAFADVVNPGPDLDLVIMGIILVAINVWSLYRREWGFTVFINIKGKPAQFFAIIFLVVGVVLIFVGLLKAL